LPRLTWKILAGAALLVAFALGGAALASGSGFSSHARLTVTTTTPAGTPRTPETPLTGDVLAKVTAAAIAKVGGTVDAATTENDGSDANAAYEAHVTKADGSHVTVTLDKSYAVLSVETGGPGGRHGFGDHGLGGPGGGHRGPGNGETPLTGDTATKAKAAAVAKTGGTADLATTENDSSNAAAVYEVHVTKADGSHVEVILDKDFNVLTVETHAAPSIQNTHRF
jgi:uncharacterized membrane protein YkoI